jgi:hypothetical protein
MLALPYSRCAPGIVRPFRAINDAIGIPIMLYNYPGRTGVDMPPEFIERLAGLKNIRYVKESTGEMPRITALLRRCGERLGVFCGCDTSRLRVCGWRGGLGGRRRQCCRGARGPATWWSSESWRRSALLKSPARAHGGRWQVHAVREGSVRWWVVLWAATASALPATRAMPSPWGVENADLINPSIRPIGPILYHASPPTSRPAAVLDLIGNTPIPCARTGG